MLNNLYQKFKVIFLKLRFFFIFVALGLLLMSFYFFLENNISSKYQNIKNSFSVRESTLNNQIASISAELFKLKNDDQYKKNKQLETEITNINNTYRKAVTIYENIIDLRDSTKVSTSKFEQNLANSLGLLAVNNYASAEAALNNLNNQIKDAQELEAAKNKPTPPPVKPKATPTPIVVDNSLPTAGYKRQNVQTDSGIFMIDIVAADLSNTKIIVDTASSANCYNDCPVLPLADYVNRNSAIAGINGTYFCPASYPSCAGKTNSFDNLLMNKSKYIFNETDKDLPIAVFSGNNATFMTRGGLWDKNTSVDAAVTNYPLLILNSQTVFASSTDPKHLSKGSRSFIATKNNYVYIGVGYNVTVADLTKVLSTLGIQNALNLDSGGSTALYAAGGYKAGPGRNIPNSILFVRR